jgi:hypothetical protein
MTATRQVTTDVANFTASTVTAVLQRHTFTDDSVRHDVWPDTRQVTTDSCDRPTDLPQLAMTTRRAAEPLSAAHGGLR